MAKKKIETVFKLQLTGGQATPAPPVGTALGPRGVNIGEFVKQFNDATRQDTGTIVTVEITTYADRSFSFIIKSPPASVLIKKALGIPKGSGNTPTTMVGKLSYAQAVEIANKKMPDITAADIAAAVRSIQGTARSMGVEVEDAA